MLIYGKLILQHLRTNQEQESSMTEIATICRSSSGV